jgi:hypothetical protein
MRLLAKAEPSIAEGNPHLGGEMMRAGKAPAARFEISVDGVPRSHCDRREIAVEAAGRLMAKYPHSAVAVKDLQSGGRVAVSMPTTEPTRTTGPS